MTLYNRYRKYPDNLDYVFNTKTIKKQPVYKHICKECQKPFSSTSKNHSFCSIICQNRNIAKGLRTNIVGKKFGKLLVIEQNFQTQKCLCRCDCGNEKWIAKGAITSGRTQSCGCFHYEKTSKHLEGKRFGKLLVLQHKSKNGISGYLCKCDCGNEKWAATSKLLSGHITSCGCKIKETFEKTRNDYFAKNNVQGTCLKSLEKKTGKNNTSGTKGVCYAPSLKTWLAYIVIRGKHITKRCSTKEKAIIERKKLEEEYFKPILDKYNKNT